jgi:hypothetical protein
MPPRTLREADVQTSARRTASSRTLSIPDQFVGRSGARAGLVIGAREALLLTDR